MLLYVFGPFFRIQWAVSRIWRQRKHPLAVELGSVAVAAHCLAVSLVPTLWQLLEAAGVSHHEITKYATGALLPADVMLWGTLCLGSFVVVSSVRFYRRSSPRPGSSFPLPKALRHVLVGQRYRYRFSSGRGIVGMEVVFEVTAITPEGVRYDTCTICDGVEDWDDVPEMWRAQEADPEATVERVEAAGRTWECTVREQDGDLSHVPLDMGWPPFVKRDGADGSTLELAEIEEPD